MGKKRKIALSVIDYQKDFAEKTGKLYVPGGEKLKATIGHLILLARQQNTDVLFYCDQHNSPDPEFEVWPPHCIAGTDGAQMIIQPKENDIVIRKSSFEYSAFAPRSLGRKTSALKLILKNKKVGALILTGLAYDFCVGETAIDAAKLGFEVFIIEDCTAAVAIPGKDGGPNSEEAMRAKLDAASVKHISFLEAAKMLGSIS